MSLSVSAALFYVGIDWVAESRAVCVLDDAGRVKVEFTIVHSAAGFTDLIRRLAKLGDPADAPVAIERPDGRLVDALLEAGHPVVPVKPNAVKAWRDGEVSGKHRAVHFRWACTTRFRVAMTTFADNSRHASPWAAGIYNRARTSGKDHPHAVRVLARAWTRVIYRCWIDQTPYDPTRHGAASRLLDQDPAA